MVNVCYTEDHVIENKIDTNLISLILNCMRTTNIDEFKRIEIS